MGLKKAALRVEEGSFAALPEASLTDPDPAARRRAVQALGSGADVIETLVWMLRGEPDNAVRQAAFTALAAIASPEAARGLACLLTEPDPALRNGALEALGTMPDAAAAMLEPLGHHADPDVRGFAVLLASALHRKDACDWMIALAERESDANVCAHLAEALGGMDSPGARPALAAISARFADNAYVSFAVEIALKRLGDR